MEQFVEGQKGKVCKNCKTKFPLSHFPINSYCKGVAYRSSYCRPCLSESRGQRQREKRKSTNEERFFQCLNYKCNYTWDKRRGQFCSKCGDLGEI